MHLVNIACVFMVTCLKYVAVKKVHQNGKPRISEIITRTALSFAKDTKINKISKNSVVHINILKQKRLCFALDRYSETDYFENDLRKVYPYYFTFSTFSKERWVGEKILDVFKREFSTYHAYEKALKSGTLMINYKNIDKDYRFKLNDIMTQVIYRQELPVTSKPIDVIHIDNDIVAVNKPASIPVHPCGKYRHNTVVYILAKEHNIKNLIAIYRLDRLASGLLLLGRNPKRTKEIQNEIRNRNVQKEYICKVHGKFPDEEIECKDPIEKIRNKINLSRVSSNGKDSLTLFKQLAYNANSNTSVVLCQPKTGRTHQIRVHLQYLGYPIINDPIYNHPVFGSQRGKGGDTGGKTYEQIVEDMIAVKNKDMTSIHSIIEKRINNSRIKNNNMNVECSKNSPDPNCYYCSFHSNNTPQDLTMCLHAWKYKGPGWTYEAKLPEWARID